MKIYIAAPGPIRGQAIALMQKLEGEGFTVISRWLRQLDDDGEEAACGDLEDIAAADVLVALNPEEWRNNGTGGRHAEFGYARALAKHLVLYGIRSHVFHHLNEVVVVSDEDSLLTALRELSS